MEKEEMQGKIFEMSMMENKLKHLDQQLGLVEQQLAEDTKLGENLNNLKDKEQSEAVLSLGGGVFVKGNVNSTKEVIINVGSGVFIEKSIDEGINFIGKRKDKLLEARGELGSQIKEIVSSMAEIENKLRG